MSQHRYVTEYCGRPVTIAAGWDRPLQGCHMVIWYNDCPDDADPDDEFVFTNLDGKIEDAHPPTFEPFDDVLQQLGLSIPRAMREQIDRDARNNEGNLMITFTDPEPEQAETDPLRRALVNEIENIDQFDRECQENDYTDTQEVWDLLNGMRDRLRAALTAGPFTEYELTEGRRDCREHDPEEYQTGTSKCTECGSTRVEYSIPAWFDANTHEQVGVDTEADVMYTYCHKCEESRSGNWLETIE